MDRPDSRYSRTPSTGRTATRGAGTDGYTGGYHDVRADGGAGSKTAYRDYESYDDYDPHADDRRGYRREHDDDHDDGYDADYDEIYAYEDPIDRRWIWVAGVAGAILLIAVICTVIILGGGDSGSVSKTVIATPATTPPVATSTVAPTTTSVAPPRASQVPLAPLSPETVTTLAPSPTPSATVAPAPVVPAPAPAAVLAPNTFTYQVTGTRPLLDLVTVVYTDSQGALQTDFNVTLPWTRTITLDPGVELKSVTATSLTGQLNCAITDASGAPITAQATNSMITSCTK